VSTHRVDSTDIEVQLFIDDHPAHTSLVHFLPQQVPFPGGHTYTMRVVGPTVNKRLNLGREPSQHPDYRQQHALINALDSVIPNLGESADYFINTVDYLKVEPGVVSIRGRCSPIVRHQADPVASA